MNDNIYYHKKPNIRKIILSTLVLFLFLGTMYFLSFFVLNPAQVIKSVNSGKMSPAYSRDYIFSLIPETTNTNIDDLEIIINRDVNSIMSESFENISFNSGSNTFEWEKFNKFDTAIIKTPYDSRYIKFENYTEQYYNDYPQNKSNLAFLLSKYLDKKSNFLLDFNKYNQKKLKIYNEGTNLLDRFRINYEISFSQETSQAIFIELLENIWNSQDMLTFFKNDDDIQNKLGIDNNTKQFIDFIYNIKNTSEVKSSRVGLILNKDFIESIAYEFNISYTVDGKSYNVKINIGEYLKSFSDDVSPEDTFNPLSVTDFELLTPYSDTTNNSLNVVAKTPTEDSTEKETKGIMDNLENANYDVLNIDE